MSLPRILLWDIEKTRMRLQLDVYQLKLYSKYLPHQAVVRDGWLPCAAWKWLGDNYIASTSVLNDPERFEECFYDDYHVVKTLHELISNADVIVAHNGDNFDWKELMARCIMHGLAPPPKPRMIDTLKVARREFRFPSNSLAYLAKKAGVAEKMKAPNWDLVMEGDADEIKRADTYCRGDIRSLEGVYLWLKPYMRNHPNLNAIMTGAPPHSCPSCGHWDVQRRGFRYTNAGKYQRYQCLGCGSWSQDKKNIKKVELK